jgi:hypothetical protein
MRKRMNSLRLTSSNDGPPKASSEREMAVAEIRREVNGAMLGNTALELVGVVLFALGTVFSSLGS